MVRLKRIVAISLIIFCAVISNVYAIPGTTTDDNVKIRKAPTTKSAIVATLGKEGVQVEIYEVTENDKGEDWYRVKYGEVEGYTYAPLLAKEGNVPIVKYNPNATPLADPTEAPNEEPEAPEETQPEPPVNNDHLVGSRKLAVNAKVYITPSVSASYKVELKKGDNIEITKVINGWAKMTSGSASGWIRIANVEKTE
jgi:uncharacterized protein YgiM (DUF1202 family)